MFLHHLVVAKDDAEGLAQDDVKEPEQSVVRVARDYVFKLPLSDHAGNVHHHQDKGNEVYHREYSHHYELVEHGRHSEGRKEAHRRGDLASAERVVDMPDQEVVDGVVPLAPVLTQIVGIPPITVEFPVCEVGQFGPKIQVAVEEAVEHRQPNVGCWDCHVQGCIENFEELSFPDWLHGCFTDRQHVLRHQVKRNQITRN